MTEEKREPRKIDSTKARIVGNLLSGILVSRTAILPREIDAALEAADRIMEKLSR